MSNYKSYFLKSLGLKEDQISGGKGDETTTNQVEKDQLAMGIKVEMEHTKDPNLAREIALDHLTEDPQYYSKLKDAGIADELKGSKLGETCPKNPSLSKLISPTAIMPTPVIAVGVRGTKTGLLPAGGIVDDPEKARLGGLELVKNLKPNSQGAIANTPSSDQIKADGGHFTPDNADITKGGAPETNVPGSDNIHPMQVQQLGNKPFNDDGTTRSGAETPASVGGGGPKNTATKSEPEPTLSDPSSDTSGNSEPSLDTFIDKGDEDTEDLPAADEPGENRYEPNEPEAEEEPRKGPWGIDMDDEEAEEDEDEDEDETSIDIKESHDQPPKGWEVRKVKYFNPKTKQNKDVQWISKEKPSKNDDATPSQLKERFMKLANIKEGWAMGEYTPEQQQALAVLQKRGFREVSTFPAEPDADGGNMGEQVVIVVQKKTGIGRYSGEIEPDGTVNGQPVETFLSGIREAGLTSESDKITQLRELVGRLNAKGTVTPILAKAQKYLKEIDSKGS